MEYSVPPPPAPTQAKYKSGDNFQKIQIDGQDKRHVIIQKAQVRDVENILELINGFAASNLMLPRGPQYLYENIRDFIIVSDHKATANRFLETKEPLYPIVACGSLHVLWDDIAEIRSLAINPDYQHLGLGTNLVGQMQQDAQNLGIKQLFTFTLRENFFRSLGFRKIQRENLPSKVWGECSRCPKYFQCDEVGMVLDL